MVNLHTNLEVHACLLHIDLVKRSDTCDGRVPVNDNYIEVNDVLLILDRVLKRFTTFRLLK